MPPSSRAYRSAGRRDRDRQAGRRWAALAKPSRGRIDVEPAGGLSGVTRSAAPSRAQAAGERGRGRSSSALSSRSLHRRRCLRVGHGDRSHDDGRGEDSHDAALTLDHAAAPLAMRCGSLCALSTSALDDGVLGALVRGEGKRNEREEGKGSESHREQWRREKGEAVIFECPLIERVRAAISQKSALVTGEASGMEERAQQSERGEMLNSMRFKISATRLQLRLSKATVYFCSPPRSKVKSVPHAVTSSEASVSHLSRGRLAPCAPPLRQLL